MELCVALLSIVFIWAMLWGLYYLLMLWYLIIDFCYWIGFEYFSFRV